MKCRNKDCNRDVGDRIPALCLDCRDKIRVDVNEAKEINDGARLSSNRNR